MISLAPSTTEILFALGLDKEIVGVSSICDYPPQAADKEKVGTFSDPNIEKILALRPDIIFCTGLEQGPAAAKFKNIGIKVSVSDPSSFRELFASITQIAAAVGKENQGAGLIAGMRRRIDDARKRAKSIPADKRVRVFVEIWHSPVMTAGAGTFIDELITIAGGVNIFHDVGRPYFNAAGESVIKADPQVIILGYMDDVASAEIPKKRFGWSNISAVKNNRVYDDIDPDLFLRPSPRLVEGLEQIQKKILEAGES